MSFIISRGYAEVQILKTSESDPLRKKKKKKKKKKKERADTLRYRIFVCNIGSAILHFRM